MVVAFGSNPTRNGFLDDMRQLVHKAHAVSAWNGLSACLGKYAGLLVLRERPLRRLLPGVTAGTGVVFGCGSIKLPRDSE